jgi:hypothetical protein
MFKPSLAARKFPRQHFDDWFLCVRENPARPIGLPSSLPPFAT